MCPIKYNADWSNNTPKNKEDELNKYGEVFIYRDKIIPHNLINGKVRRWFEDREEDEA